MFISLVDALPDPPAASAATVGYEIRLFFFWNMSAVKRLTEAATPVHNPDMQAGNKLQRYEKIWNDTWFTIQQRGFLSNFYLIFRRGKDFPISLPIFYLLESINIILLQINGEDFLRWTRRF